jgi:hypothetical protein
MKHIYVVQVRLMFPYQDTWRSVGIFSSKIKAFKFVAKYSYVTVRCLKQKLNPRIFDPIETDNNFTAPTVRR